MPGGPFSVAIADIAVPADGSGCRHGLAGRLFYPCQRSWTWPVTWIPSYAYARGYVEYLLLYSKKSLKAQLARLFLTPLAWALGVSKRLDAYYEAPLLGTGTAGAGAGLLPAVVFSHGLAGTRNAYSSICIELASQGYLVLSIEHSDGSASAAQLADRPAEAAVAGTASTAPTTATTPQQPPRIEVDWRGRAWRFYGGLGDRAAQVAKTSHRMAEADAAYQLLERLHAGDVRGGSIGLPRSLVEQLQGRLDLGRVAVAGHSYGGATAAAAAAAKGSRFACAVCLDPWWEPFLPDWPVVTSWSRPTPMLVIGSHDWNTPNAEGKLKCSGEGQERVLAAAAAGGGGAVFVVPRGSSHSSFDDVLLLFGSLASPALRLLGMKSKLEPKKAHEINMWTITHFLKSYMPATDGRALRGGVSFAADAATAGARGGAPADGSAPAAAGDGEDCAGNCPGDGAAGPKVVRDQHLEAYRSRLGDWAAILRVVPSCQKA